MNERIYELAKQADLIEWDILPSGARTPDHESVVKAQKFAELIVRECSSLIVKNAPRVTCKEELHLGYVSDGYIDAADLIKQRFGVKDEPKNS